MTEPGWTLDELVRRAREALAADDVRAPNGRVTPQPDRRVVRWYATIGLVDRPLAYRGRAAVYGPRHLLQVVAVKRRQAEGRALAQIQAELTGATDATLRAVARVPAHLLSAGSAATAAGAGAGGDPAAPGGPAAPSVAGGAAAPGSAGVPPARFWAGPAPATGPAPAPVPIPVPAPAPARRQPDAGLLYAVVLHDGATLVLRRSPGPDDLAAVRDAAGPLLDLLAHRGLLHRPHQLDPLTEADHDTGRNLT